jgi:hypothetical protein
MTARARPDEERIASLMRSAVSSFPTAPASSALESHAARVSLKGGRVRGRTLRSIVPSSLDDNPPSRKRDADGSDSGPFAPTNLAEVFEAPSSKLVREGGSEQLRLAIAMARYVEENLDRSSKSMAALRGRWMSSRRPPKPRVTRRRCTSLNATCACAGRGTFVSSDDRSRRPLLAARAQRRLAAVPRRNPSRSTVKLS